VEPDIRYYRRRACEEMAAASRAVTDEARERRLRLVETYVEHLKALKAPIPFSDSDIAQAHRASTAGAYCYKQEAVV
jgi:hypothetical protein